LVKHVLKEIGSGWVSALLAAETAIVSEPTITEAASALARRARNGEMTHAAQEAIYQRLLGALDSCVVVQVSRAVIDRAAVLLLAMAAPPRLRTLDALHRASAQLAFATAIGRGRDRGYFVTADRALITAAAWAGLTTMNPDEHPRWPPRRAEFALASMACPPYDQ